MTDRIVTNDYRLSGIFRAAAKKRTHTHANIHYSLKGNERKNCWHYQDNMFDSSICLALNCVFKIVSQNIFFSQTKWYAYSVCSCTHTLSSVFSYFPAEVVGAKISNGHHLTAVLGTRSLPPPAVTVRKCYLINDQRPCTPHICSYATNISRNMLLEWL